MMSPWLARHDGRGNSVGAQPPDQITVPVRPWPEDETFPDLSAVANRKGMLLGQKPESLAATTLARGGPTAG